MKDDTISRQAAIAVADYTDCVGLAIEDVKRVTDEVVKGLKKLPSAQQETSILTVKCELDDEELNRVIEDIKNAKLITAQQDIIRCKDCGRAACVLPEGMLYCMVHERYLSEDDYCSYGVKEDGRHNQQI